jgi:hypothetical protein
MRTATVENSPAPFLLLLLLVLVLVHMTGRSVGVFSASLSSTPSLLLSRRHSYLDPLSLLTDDYNGGLDKGSRRTSWPPHRTPLLQSSRPSYARSVSLNSEKVQSLLTRVQARSGRRRVIDWW